MKWVAIILGVLVALVLVVTAIGATLPKSHVVVRSARFHRPVEVLFNTVIDVPATPTWRKDIQRIEMLPPKGSRFAWREVSSNGTVTYEGEVVRMPEPSVPGRFITRITDKTLPYGGEWIIDVATTSEGSIVIVTENGEVYNPIFRFVSKYVMGQTTTIDEYLRALGRHFGEAVTPVDAAPV